jgi:hypothetical protein
LVAEASGRAKYPDTGQEITSFFLATANRSHPGKHIQQATASEADQR